ncbi:hypothetical protein ATHSA_0340 [Athalassotoga saccharophila]|nr:hypothetical protein ATHSA_0340 [Athalassotoga saccharophila]
MPDREEEIKEIVRACAEDMNLRRIVFQIEEMNEDQRSSFELKMVNYFLGKNSNDDLQVYKFFKLILDASVRDEVISKIKEGKT